MIPGMNPREMQKAMKRLGISQEEIDAKIVIIKTSGKDLLIKNPHVTKFNMMGQETFQVVGDIEEAEEEHEISEDDVATVISQAGCSREDALDALKLSDGNLAEAILKLQGK
ncbi:nascent polypeptide-associated complex protein [Candidatus Woesearchaeota archaeon]|nr:nascent polypeptide-associated complex protein [Candidatus Woesearchaeota archaeon]